MRLGFLGNFIPPHSTENDRAWSFRKLGHEVVQFQESTTTAAQLLDAMPDLDMLIYSHTHDPSYVVDGLADVFRVYANCEIPTVSAHLDRWLWLARESDMGVEATWSTEHLFMADMSPEMVEKLTQLGIVDRAHYLAPGVVERDCYMAEPDHSKYPHPIVFVGSRGYHPEYAWRPAMIDSMKRIYGKDFGHYGGDGIASLRGHDLNVLMATAEVVVGDSCFGGRPYYASDRVMETRGRGGFLLHPYVEGVDMTGVGLYDPCDVDSLRSQIDYYRNRPGEREAMRFLGHEHVKAHETYTNRSQEMIDQVFPYNIDGLVGWYD